MVPDSRVNFTSIIMKKGVSQKVVPLDPSGTKENLQKYFGRISIYNDLLSLGVFIHLVAVPPYHPQSHLDAPGHHIAAHSELQCSAPYGFAGGNTKTGEGVYI